MFIVSIGFYSEDEYKILLECADDRSDIDDKWEDWLVGFIKAKTGLIKDFTIEEVHLDVKKMNDYFKSKNMKNTSSTRAAYINEIGMKNHQAKMNN